MAITQAQADKDWSDSPSTSSPIMAADLEAMGRRSRDLRWMIPTGATSIDEFDDDTLAAAWTRVDGTGAVSGNVTWAEGGDSLSEFNNGSDSSAFHGLVVPLSSFGGSMATGDAFVTCIRIVSPVANDALGGIVLSTSATHGSGEQVIGTYYSNSTADTLIRSYSISGWGAIVSNAGTFSVNRGGQYHLRLVYLGSNNWRTDASPDGVTWIKGLANLSKTMTPTHVGLASSSYLSGLLHVASYEYLRRVSGIS